MTVRRELVLLRHAQAESRAETGRDFDRVLTGFGRGQPEGVGRRLMVQGWRPQRVLCSASARTRETLALLEGSLLCADAERALSQRIYECSTRELLLELADTEEGVQRLLVIGHNPSLSDLATLMTGQMVGLSPADYVGIECRGEWAALEGQPACLMSL